MFFIGELLISIVTVLGVAKYCFDSSHITKQIIYDWLYPAMIIHMMGSYHIWKCYYFLLITDYICHKIYLKWQHGISGFQFSRLLPKITFIIKVISFGGSITGNNSSIKNKANLRDLIAASGLVTLLKFDTNHPHFFVPCDLEIWWMILENNRAPFLFYIKLCASFQSHGLIQSGVTVRKRSILKNRHFLSRVTLKFDRWPWKTIGHLYYTTSSFVNHFEAKGEIKLELHSGNPQVGSKSAIFVARVTLILDGWTWNTIGLLFYVASSSVHRSIAISEFKLELQSRNAQFGSESIIFCPV